MFVECERKEVIWEKKGGVRVLEIVDQKEEGGKRGTAADALEGPLFRSHRWWTAAPPFTGNPCLDCLIIFISCINKTFRSFMA